MNRFLLGISSLLMGTVSVAVASVAATQADSSLSKDWLARWQKSIVAESKSRYCDKEMGEELGWLVSPYLNGYYYGYLATRDQVWIDRLVDWTDSWIKRGVMEPDGFIGWPKSGTGGLIEDELYTDSLLGEAMAFRPVVLISAEIKSNPALRSKYGSKADSYLRLAEQTYIKWMSRGCWRDLGVGGVWVVPAFGIDQKSGQWTSGYSNRLTSGFSNPDNKENAIAEWLLAMYDATGREVYKARAEQWFRTMKSRIKTREGGKYFVWNYWEPAGPWDYKPDGSTKHWVGVHPNGGYYGIDVDAIVEAYEHGLVFSKGDIDKLVATNRDFMWNHEVSTAKFQRIDGGPVDARWKNSPGALWSALIPYDPTLKRVFEKTFDPASWSGIAATPRYIFMLKP